MNVPSKAIPGAQAGLKSRRSGIKAHLTHRSLRRVVQTGVAAFIIFLAVQWAVAGKMEQL